MNRMPVPCLVALGSLLLASCGEDSGRIAGNSANTGNAVASGRVLLPSGQPAQGAWVECRPLSLAPWDPSPGGWTSITDGSGTWRCVDLPAGSVGVRSLDPRTGLSAWHADTIWTDSVSSHHATDTLSAPGGLRVALPPGSAGTLYLEGLGISHSVRGESEISLEEIPAGWHGNLRLALSTKSSTILDSTLRVRSGVVDSSGFTRDSTRLRVDLAGSLASALVQFPVLVRLDSSWHGWSATLGDGSDLRLSTPTGSPLPLTMESFDPVRRTAAFWTVLDTLKAPGASIEFRLSWGLPVASTRPASAFTSARGWLAAWPLGDSTATALDQTGRFPAILQKATTVEGPIAKATHFDGKTQAFVDSTQAAGLALPEGGPYTFSCWARLARTTGSQTLMGRGQYGAELGFRVTGTTAYWEASEYRSSPSGRKFVRAPADSGRWTHLVFTATDTNLAVYVDGALASSTFLFDANDSARQSTRFLIGTSIDTKGLTSTHSHFQGDLSDAWVQSVARSADWIRLAAQNQKSGGKAATILP